MLSVRQRYYDTQEVVDGDNNQCRSRSRICRSSSNPTNQCLCRRSFENEKHHGSISSLPRVVAAIDGQLEQQQLGRHSVVDTCHTELRDDNYNDTSVWIQGLYAAWWWCTFGKAIARGCGAKYVIHPYRKMRLFRRMWIWTQCDEGRPKQRQRRRSNKVIDQSGAWERLHVSSIGIATTNNRFRNIDECIKATTPGCNTSVMSWWKILLLLTFLNAISNGVEGYVGVTDRRWICAHKSRTLLATTTRSRLVMHTVPLEFKRRSFRRKKVRGMLFVKDDDECVDDDEIVSLTGTEMDENTVLGEMYDTGGVLLNDLSWRVEKLRLEEQNIQRFLKARPRFLPYNECRKWVQAFNRWQTEDDWNEWIAMGEKRNAYIPSRPDEYYGRLGQWVSWDHFLLGSKKRHNSSSSNDNNSSTSLHQQTTTALDYDVDNEFR